MVIITGTFAPFSTESGSHNATCIFASSGYPASCSDAGRSTVMKCSSYGRGFISPWTGSCALDVFIGNSISWRSLSGTFHHSSAFSTLLSSDNVSPKDIERNKKTMQTAIVTESDMLSCAWFRSADESKRIASIGSSAMKSPKVADRRGWRFYGSRYDVGTV